MLGTIRLPRTFSSLTRDGRLLFTTRVARLFAYGFLSVVLVLYLAEVGLSEARIGVLLTLTLIGDTAISLWMTTSADRIGRRWPNPLPVCGVAIVQYRACLPLAQPRAVRAAATCPDGSLSSAEGQLS